MKKENLYICDFCGGSQASVLISEIIKGENDAAICNNCVSLCAVIILAKIAERREAQDTAKDTEK